MTALFVVMLVLFVLSYKLLSDSEKATKAELDKIREIQKISEQLDTNFFTFQSKYKRFVLKHQPKFVINSDVINDNDKEHLRKVGRSLNVLLDSLKNKHADSLRFLILIEGMSSKIGSNPDPNNLSYRRALAVYNFWNGEKIEFDTTYCEIIISGSGIYGVGRYQYDPSNIELESKNQRILIQVIPKTSNTNAQNSSNKK